MRKPLILVMALLAAALSGCGGADAPALARTAGTPQRRPNILLIVVDTLRYDALSPARTPNIAALAGRGVSFRNAYSTWDETTISHFSLLTGFSANAFESGVNRASFSVADELKQAGYHTFGTAANLQLSKKALRAVQPFDDYVCLGDEWEGLPAAQRDAAVRELDPRIRAYGGRLTDFNRLMAYVKGERVLGTVAAQLRRRPNAPFFGFVNLVDTHDPYFPDPRHYDAAREEAALPKPASFDGDVRNRTVGPELAHPERIADAKRRAFVESMLKRVDNRAWSTTIDLEPAALALYRHRYDAGAGQADAVVGGLLKLLRDERLLSSTIVIVTSDHGESFGESHLITHAFGDHGDYESLHHVPLVWAFPPSYGVVPGVAGQRVSLADVAPTLYDLAGLDWRPLAKQAVAPVAFGTSLFADVRSGEKALARTPAAGEPSDRKAVDAERKRRLRSLGYIH